MFTRVLGGAEHRVPLLVADPGVRGIHHFMGIAVRARIVANAAGAGPIRPQASHLRRTLRRSRPDRSRRGHAKERRTRAEQASADKIPACHPGGRIGIDLWVARVSLGT